MKHITLTVLNHKGKPLKDYDFSGPLIDESKLKENRKGFVYVMEVR
jgi:hypothetical protein